MTDMTEKKETTLDIVLGRMSEIPLIDLPQYIKEYGNVLPGISENHIQILTSEELNSLPVVDALRCRLRFIVKYLNVALNTIGPIPAEAKI